MSDKSNGGKAPHAETKLSKSELKFQEAKGKLTAAVQKHIQDYETSSSEEEIETELILDKITKTYKNTGGKDEYLTRTETFLQDSVLPGTAICLICISRVKREEQIWNCIECYCAFHLNCIQRWSKDNVFQQKLTQENASQRKALLVNWHCPKCRHAYEEQSIPNKYFCFCGKSENPECQQFLVPHSCGEICGKSLVPECGHKCLLLCHPGPCPVCPVTVNVTCYCGSAKPTARRCSYKEWSCGKQCNKLLSCKKHNCQEPCHQGACKPCPKKSYQFCVCRKNRKLKDCAIPIWRCDLVCSRQLSCGNHCCEKVCHPGDCDPCPLTNTRTCSCGKSKFKLPCTEETPTCPDTCEKLLSCGHHSCNQRCHKEACGMCLEIVTKLCKCGLHSKEIQCYKSYTCETKCKRMKDCNKHTCNKKCCDGNCPSCEKPCGRTLNCGNHKCTSVCHRGLCYPCAQTETVTCRCTKTKLTVPCGRKYKTKPPKCSELCLLPADCHHKKREPHKCHFGTCPPCKQICDKKKTDCPHNCLATCHSAVLVKIETQKASMPWEQTQPQVEKRNLPCPDCRVLVLVTCLGGHETVDFPCYLAKPASCHRSCGRILACGNHLCSLPCHVVEDAPSARKAGNSCEVCESPCDKGRSTDCQHECPKLCHSGPCPPCKQMLRIKCHCGLNQPYVRCSDWLKLENREKLQSCGNQCPKNFECGHRCRANCHSGTCPNSDRCNRKVKVACKCRRLKKEIPCELVRKNLAKVACDEVCELKKGEERKKQEKMMEEKQREEKLRNEKELAKYKKLFEGKKKNRERRVCEEVEDLSFFQRNKFILLSGSLLSASVFIFYCYKA